MNKVVLAAVIVVGLGIAYYFLYQYNYNEAKDTVFLVLPDYILAYAQQKSGLTDEDLKLLDEIQKKVNENANKTTLTEGDPTTFATIGNSNTPTNTEIHIRPLQGSKSIRECTEAPNKATGKSIDKNSRVECKPNVTFTI
jgi:hypothetical protein